MAYSTVNTFIIDNYLDEMWASPSPFAPGQTNNINHQLSFSTLISELSTSYFIEHRSGYISIWKRLLRTCRHRLPRLKKNTSICPNLRKANVTSIKDILVLGQVNSCDERYVRLPSTPQISPSVLSLPCRFSSTFSQPSYKSVSSRQFQSNPFLPLSLISSSSAD